jgi:ABC-type transporter Mla MlaB component
MPQNIAASVPLVLDGALTMRTVETVRAILRAALEPPSANEAGIAPAVIAIDCSAATEIDLTFIQLLIAARVSASTAGRSLSLAPCPDGVLLDTLTRGGFRIEPATGGFWFTGEAA